MTRSEALARGFCARCASYSGMSGEAEARQWCAIGRTDDQCPMSPQYREWLVRNHLVEGRPDPTVDLGPFEGVKPAGRGA